MSQDTIYISGLETVSPTLLESLRSCELRAGLSRSDGADRFALGNTKAWLGTAYHHVLENIADEADVESGVGRLWSASIEKQWQRNQEHPLNSRFGEPESWYGYDLYLERARIKAEESINASHSSRDTPFLPQAGSRFNSGEDLLPKRRTETRERRGSAMGGKLVGFPDLIQGKKVVDYKTGGIYDDAEKTKLKDSYVRQLRLYAVIIESERGWWPESGVIEPATGDAVSIEIDPDECLAEAAEAVAFLERYNQRLVEFSDPGALANPSPSACRWCPYKLCCARFWEAATPEWEETLGTNVVVGSATQGPVEIQQGAAFSLTLDIEAGTNPVDQEITLHPIDPSVHHDIADIATGDRVRVTGLKRLADGRLVPTAWTLIQPEKRAPEIEKASMYGN